MPVWDKGLPPRTHLLQGEVIEYTGEEKASSETAMPSRLY